MLHAVIMAGGSGTRFWPESRSHRPKQLLRMFGQKSLLQEAVERLGGVVALERIWVATTQQLAPAVAEQLPELRRDAILIEPCKRDTAPCIGLAALRLLRDDPDATMAVLPADQRIAPVEAFQQTLRLAEQLVHEDPSRLITFGIRPTYPAETFGYIERGEPIPWQPSEAGIPVASEPVAGSPASAPSSLGRTEAGPQQSGWDAQKTEWPRVYRVRKFHEKPKASVAQQYLESGRFYWNSGIFVWKARTILDQLRQHQPDMYAHLERIGQSADTPAFDRVLQEEFSAIRGLSIDYAVMEKAQNVLVIEAPFGWDDVGNWRALERLLQADAAGNVLAAERTLLQDTSRCIIRSTDPKHLVVVVGLQDLLIVVTPDATLVADKRQEESLRKITQWLAERGWTEYL
ncbi:MAG: mannose-1-phosphate guanylyltransferase [Thermoguttaceae bacterium]|nr:mannose-1-phosphate guanylyltransferase [Thermoguttaceae bacterium]